MSTPLTALPGGQEAGGTEPHAILGEHSYPVYPQRIGYLENKLGKTLGKLIEGNIASDSLLSFLLGNAYELLRVFIPRLMPEHEFRGYRTAEDLAAGNYDADADASPSNPQIVEAFQLVMRVNRFDIFGSLGKLVDADLLRGLLSAQMAARLTGDGSAIESSTTIPATTSTDSGTTSPTSTESAD